MLIRGVYLVAATVATLAGSAHAAERYSGTPVEIAVTEHGIPHIKAADYHGLGYGYGYAIAMVDLCGAAETFVTYSGQRARYFGEDGSVVQHLLDRKPLNNVTSDLVTRAMVGDKQIAEAREALSTEALEIVDGYVKGYNEYLAVTPPDTFPIACRNASWVQPITEASVIGRLSALAVLLGTSLHYEQIFAAHPPASGATPLLSQASTAPVNRNADILGGSNAYAFGADLTTNGRGLLLGNPHFFWDGPNRFVEMHLTIPGKYDAMGASLVGFPLIMVGFNQSLAWTHTVDTAAKFTLYELKLDPKDPTHYLVDGRSIPMRKTIVSAPVTAKNGTTVTRTHEFWSTEYGPILQAPDLPWTREKAYSIADANQQNYRLLDQWLGIGRSSNVASLKTNLSGTIGLPWVNTIAADAEGNAFYGDVAVVPNIDKSQLEACQIQRDKFKLTDGMVMLDGARSACRWKVAKGTPQPGILPASALPTLIRRDYVENSNASYWLSNPASLLEGYSPVIGPERTPRNVRTRQGHVQVEDRLSGRDGLPGTRFDRQSVETILFSDRVLMAEDVLDDLLAACRQTPTVIMPDGTSRDLHEPCKILSEWNRHLTLDSVGGHLFHEFTEAVLPSREDLSKLADFWRVPFNANDPVHTPRGLKTDTPAALQALARAADRLRAAKIPLDAPLRDVQFVVRNGERIPLHGGKTFSVISATFVDGVGYTDPIMFGNSYIQAVSFDDEGPVADAVLVSSQAPDPASPYYADQTKLYSEGKWVRLPFTSEQIDASVVSPKIVLYDVSSSVTVTHDLSRSKGK